MRAIELFDTLAVVVVAWALAISLVIFTLLGSAALIQSNSRSDQDVCVQHGGKYELDSTSPVPGVYKESCTK